MPGRNQGGGTTHFRCFELSDLNFLVDPNFDMWLLKANSKPDLSKVGDRQQTVIENVLEDTLALVLGERTNKDNKKNKTQLFVKV